VKIDPIYVLKSLFCLLFFEFHEPIILSIYAAPVKKVYCLRFQNLRKEAQHIWIILWAHEIQRIVGKKRLFKT